MNDRDLHEITLWLSREGYQGTDEGELIAGFCERCNEKGLRIGRALAIIDTLHPDFEGRRLPSVGAAPFMIAGVMATEVSRIITGRGKPMAAPTIYQFDALLRQFRRRTYRFGMRSPVQRLKRALLDRVLPKQETRKSMEAPAAPAPPATPLS